MEARITAACATAGRSRASVTLVAVTKTWPATDAEILAGLGVSDFGENRDQEARGKAAALPRLRWHFVGQLQRNKCRSIASYADVVHALDRPPVVDALAAGAARAGRTVGAFVQVSLDGDPSRGGALPADVPALAEQIARGGPALRLLGVMAVATRSADPAASFAVLAEVGGRLRATHPGATAVSAGMSGDLEVAVAAGATHLRVGTALLGSRPPILG